MNLYELIEQRYSVRGYSDKPIGQAELDYIMQCARMAPSAVNRQPWHFYVCKSEQSLQKVRECYQREWFNTAPLVIIGCVCHDQEWIRPQDQHPHGLVDVSIATEHICLAATEKGLGSCWVCNFDAEKCHEEFSLPENEEAVVLIPIGYATTAYTEKKRKELGEIVTEL